MRADNTVSKPGGDHRGNRTIALAGQVFIGRFVQPVLPAEFMRVRHFRLLVRAAKVDRQARY